MNEPDFDPQGGEHKWRTEYNKVPLLCFYNKYDDGYGVVSVYCNGYDITEMLDNDVLEHISHEITNNQYPLED